LDLVEDNPGPGGPADDQGFKAVRISGKLEKKRRIEQIEPEGVGKHLLKPSALPRSSWAKEEKGSIRLREQPGNDFIACHLHPAYYDVKLQCNITTSLQE
jgi:hypothetical protein